MADEAERQEWWVTVHTEKRGPYEDRGSALVAARAAKTANPNRHVAVVNPHGHSEEVER